MNLRILILVLLPVTALMAQADIEFSGVMTSEGKTSVLLTNKSTELSRWVEVGQTFFDYAISSYDAQTEEITLTKNTVQTKLHLKAAKVKEAQVGPPEPIRKAILNNLRQISAASDQYFLENGVSRVEIAKLVGPTAYIKELKPVDGESYEGMILEQGKPIKVKTKDGFEVSYAP